MLDIITQSRRIVAAAIILVCSAVSLWPDPQGGAQITVTTAGTAVPLVPNRKTVNAVMVNSLFIQTPHCTTCGIIYVLNCSYQLTTCANGAAGTTLVAEIPAATATAPGGWFRFPTNGSASNSSGGTDLRYWAVDSAVSGVTVLTSYDYRN
jgi:hypothetical protein